VKKVKKGATSNTQTHCRAAAAREVTVTFTSEVQPGLNWTFKPSQPRIKIRPGVSTLVFYTASNNSSEDITAVSTYNVNPPQVSAARACAKRGVRRAEKGAVGAGGLLFQ